MRTDGPRTLDPIRGSTTYDNSACSMIFETLLEYEYLSAAPLMRQPCVPCCYEMPTISDDAALIYTFAEAGRFLSRQRVFPRRCKRHDG
ncbi:MAG: hypothetical protein R3B96_03740 [Pirellulaceae bacterium]